MSELEKRQRLLYRKHRKIKIIIFSIVCLISMLVALASTLQFFNIKNNSYVKYNNKSKVIYRAYLAKNDFYDVESLNGSHAYVASLIKYMTADFNYNLELETTAKYHYSYSIDAILEVKDKKTNMAIYNPAFSLVPKSDYFSESKNLEIKKLVTFDYNEYNAMAKRFIETYSLNDVTACVIVKMTVDVVGVNQAFKNDLSDSYMISVVVPLLEPTVTPSVDTTVPTGETKIQVHSDESLDTFKLITLISTCVTFVLIISLYFYIITTRDKHLEYSHKLKHIMTNYRSYVQKVSNDFDDASCKYMQVESFNELLTVRDTLRMPILVYENEDQTMAKFFIVNGELVYTYILRVID